jgi:hypothetical protein
VFELDGFITFCPLVDSATAQKTRVLLLVKAEVATKDNARLREDLMSPTVPSVYVQIDGHDDRIGGGIVQHAGVLFAAVYRTWTDFEGKTGPRVEQVHLATLIDQVEQASETARAVILMGDLNLDMA